MKHHSGDGVVVINTFGVVWRQHFCLCLLWYQDFNFRSCCGTALFQQQPADCVQLPVLTSASVMGCSWLHIDSASSSMLKLFFLMLTKRVILTIVIYT
jgi:hypothetical protein